MPNSLANNADIPGTLTPLPSAQQMESQWGLDQQEISLLQGDQYYLSADNVDLTSPSGFY